MTETFKQMRREHGFWTAVNWLLVTVTAPPQVKARNEEMRRKWGDDDGYNPSLDPKNCKCVNGVTPNGGCVVHGGPAWGGDYGSVL